ncbi:SHOCT domain-containing protein, partial [Bifidobacterium adolescentis]
AAAPPPMSVGDQLDAVKKLKELLDVGILTQDEFDSKKKQILGL